MTLNELEIILKRIEVDNYQLTRPGQLQISCPLAPWLHTKRTDRHPSMGVNFGGEITIFRCFTCGESGKLWQLIDSYARLSKSPELVDFALEVLRTDAPTLSAKLNALGEKEFMDETPLVQSIALDSSILENFYPFDAHPDSLNYVCFERKISFDVAKSFDLCYDSNKKRVVFPVYCDKDILRGAVGRSINGAEPRYYNYFGFRTGDTLGGLNHLKYNNLILVEGYFDLLNCISYANELEYDVLCCWRADVTKEQAMILTGLDRNIKVMFDMDRAGESGWRRICDLTRGAYGIKRMTWNPKMGDVGSMSKIQFLEVLSNE